MSERMTDVDLARLADFLERYVCGSTVHEDALAELFAEVRLARAAEAELESHFERVELAVKAERETCAAIVDSLATEWDRCRMDGDDPSALREAAAAIRARGNP